MKLAPSLLVLAVAACGGKAAAPPSASPGPVARARSGLVGVYSSRTTTCDSNADDKSCFPVTNFVAVHPPVDGVLLAEFSLAGTGGLDCRAAMSALTRRDDAHYQLTFSDASGGDGTCTAELEATPTAITLRFSGDGCARTCVEASFARPGQPVPPDGDIAALFEAAAPATP